MDWFSQETAMATYGTITMSMREVDRLKTAQAVVDGTLRAAPRHQLFNRLGDANTAAISAI
ncbi:hypothetical protein D3871_21270 [Noviherbaspirillum saxi]|uniref:Uncharacterized protein n=1 Tax=Noviherbaspirillum saxi TaxID=2320863 RepID=A0A3A3FR19_9BURK|nr:hypothetical protein D3871_21270 [Noviherbaspirillum saxi]